MKLECNTKYIDIIRVILNEIYFKLEAPTQNSVIESCVNDICAELEIPLTVELTASKSAPFIVSVFPNVWKCPECKKTITDTEFHLVKHDYGCQACSTSFRFFKWLYVKPLENQNK